MWYLYVSGTMSGTMTKYLLKRGVRLRKFNNVVFVCVWDHDKCLLKRGVRLRKVNNVVFVRVWDHN